MGNKDRNDYDGALHHLTNRGARRDIIYLDDEDRRRWLQLTATYFERHGCRIHAVCLMGNHFHLLARSAGTLSDAMRDALSVYVRGFNARHDFDGPLHRGPFSSKLVESDEQLLTTSRYIHRNPADFFTGPLQYYPWSSYRWFLDPASAPEWLDTELTLSLLDHDVAAYQTFVEGQAATRATTIRTPEGFIALPVRLGAIVASVASLTGVRASDLTGSRPGLRGPARLAVCVLASEFEISRSHVAEELGYGSADSVRALTSRARGRLEADPAFAALVHTARSVLDREHGRRAA